MVTIVSKECLVRIDIRFKEVGCVVAVKYLFSMCASSADGVRTYSLVPAIGVCVICNWICHREVHRECMTA